MLVRQVGPVLETLLSVGMNFERVNVFKVLILNPSFVFRRVDEGLKVTDLNFSGFFSVLFFFSSCISYNILNPSQLAPFRTLSKLPSPLWMFP